MTARLLEIMTIAMVVLKFMGVIDWSWWTVLSPVLLSCTFFIVAVIFHR